MLYLFLFVDTQLRNCTCLLGSLLSKPLCSGPFSQSILSSKWFIEHLHHPVFNVDQHVASNSVCWRGDVRPAQLHGWAGSYVVLKFLWPVSIVVMTTVLTEH